MDIPGDDRTTSAFKTTTLIFDLDILQLCNRIGSIFYPCFLPRFMQLSLLLHLLADTFFPCRQPCL
jgi:hypothetical protein